MKNDKKEKKKRNKKQNYFLNKIKEINEHKKELNTTITNLPKLESEFSGDTKIFL